MSSSSTSTKRLTDHKVLIFDVYGTLADWESGLYTALQPLLTHYPASKNWTRAEALSAFMSVEGDLQAQYPDMLYNELLAKVHETLEKRIKTLSGRGGQESVSGTLATTDPAAALTADVGASTSAAGATAAGGEDAHTAFGNSIQHWPVFPDTVDALRRLARHFKLVVLSNVDRQSFRYTHRLLSEGPAEAVATVTSQLQTYTFPDPNPHKYWHPQEAPGSKSPFTVIMTAQDTGCYKPALGGFRAALDYFASQPALFGDLQAGLGPGEQVKDRVLSVAQSLPHDHEAASRLGMRSVWIDRQAAVTCNVAPGGPGAKQKWTWRFETLGEMADTVEKELQEK